MSGFLYSIISISASLIQHFFMIVVGFLLLEISKQQIKRPFTYIVCFLLS